MEWTGNDRHHRAAVLEHRGALEFNLDSDPLRNPSVFGYSALSEVDDAALVDDVSDALGNPDDDTGWIPMPDAYACTGATEYRSLLWADIRFVLARAAGVGTSYIAAWSIGDTKLAYSPALAVEITEPSGITTADGIGLGTSADRLEDVRWAQFMRQDDRFFGLAGTGPVSFQLDATDRVVDQLRAERLLTQRCFPEFARLSTQP